MRRLHAIVTGAAGACMLVACASEPAKAPAKLRPVPEARAASIIARTFREAGLEPEADRFLDVGHDKRLRVEVAAAGRPFGVAYLTAEDWRAFGDALPPRAADDSLVVATLERGNHVLLLWADDYEEDDASASDTASSIAADRRLQRDVRDFLHRAETQGWR